MEAALVFIFGLVVFIYSVVIHEVSHGLMARSMGDTTAQDLGRLTLNPLKHLEMFGSFILPLLFYMSFGFAFGYAKPVPYNPRNLSDRRYGAAKVALAGPVANLILALLCGLTLRFFADYFPSSMAIDLLGYIVMINVLLAVFNLAPIPPLDGHWLLLTFLPPRFAEVKVFLYRYSIPLLFLYAFFGFRYLYPLVALISRLIIGY